MGAYKKTEHAGAKDSGRKSGYHGYRSNAKRWAKKARRTNGKKEIDDGRIEEAAAEGEPAPGTPETSGQEGGVTT